LHLCISRFASKFHDRFHFSYDGEACASRLAEHCMEEAIDQKRIAIAGATGYIGGRLVPHLLEEGYTVRCLVRSPEKLASREWASQPGVEVCASDLDDAASLTRAFFGCEAAFYLVHSMTTAGAGYAERDLHLAFQFAAAAKDAGLKRIVYLLLIF
jgi:uncharacterized protein YbjT (DUF2867 family)